MHYPAATPQESKKAQIPHNLFISGVFLLNLLMTPAVIALKLGMASILIPAGLMGLLIGYIFLRSRRESAWFVAAHWRLCFSRGKLLLTGYGISGLLISIGWVVSLNAKDAHMAHIIWTALTRIAVVPALIFVMITALLEFSAAAQAAKREIPDKCAAKFPPPQK